MASIPCGFRNSNDNRRHVSYSSNNGLHRIYEEGNRYKTFQGTFQRKIINNNIHFIEHFINSIHIGIHRW